MRFLSFVSTKRFREGFAIISMLALFLFTVFAQQAEMTVMEGERADSINIGESTESDVVASYGTDYKLIEHGKYSYEMLYKNLGLSFYYCSADPSKEIFVVEMEAPAGALTNKGILLGSSTIDDVLRVYGEPEEELKEGSGLEYEGIYFYAEEDTDSDDAEDARTATPPAESKDVEASTQSASSQADYSNISVVRLNTLEYFDRIDKAPEVEISTGDSDEDETEAKSKDSDGPKIVRRIELIEKSGLRQCDSKFGKLSK
ncbi:MAG TPA: hypothetical protein VMZ26_02185 [Pyrinomonadaceae bacterium]|nr:hypothetical protein [Pyrinomonadaceae bacterium]